MIGDTDRNIHSPYLKGVHLFVDVGSVAKPHHGLPGQLWPTAQHVGRGRVPQEGQSEDDEEWDSRAEYGERLPLIIVAYHVHEKYSKNDEDLEHGSQPAAYRRGCDLADENRCYHLKIM